MSSKQTQAALYCSVACWNANRGICPLHLLRLLSRCQELTDKASVTARHFHRYPHGHHRSGAMNNIPHQFAYLPQFPAFSV